jgi:hypothetical protein
LSCEYFKCTFYDLPTSIYEVLMSFLPRTKKHCWIISKNKWINFWAIIFKRKKLNCIYIFKIVARKNPQPKFDVPTFPCYESNLFVWTFFFILHDLVLGYILCVIELNFMQMLKSRGHSLAPCNNYYMWEFWDDYKTKWPETCTLLYHFNYTKW